MLNYLGLPVAASAHASDVDSLISIVHWLMAVLFVGWGGFFVFALVKFRKGANPRADYHGAKGKLSKGIEIAIVVVEAILLIFFAIPAWAKRVGSFPSETEAVVVLTTGASSKTVTCWISSPTSSRRFTTASCPTFKSIPIRTAALKPFFSAFTSCGPNGSERTLKLPPSPVVATRVAPVSTLFTVTVAPFTGIPAASSIRPEIAAVT